MFKSDKVNRIISLIVYWGIVIFVVVQNPDILTNTLFCIITLVLSITFTVTQLVKLTS
ncbi:hypothetical protein [Bacillus sp. KH172YL63]|uniref:hypothetical protein n=1 Tax=Bacillus sp. KH172YL63 TaxID=2709784 RepID=UPI0013E430DA|nr:hypothetical protein [Bacillus sp. KH172YL63]BCB04190.1 hypothetical protein KH172YL63_23230 [Bacillus sp. KH172YL63]